MYVKMPEIQIENLEKLNDSPDQEDWDEEEEDYDDDGDDDIDAEAQEIARRLGAELWADLSKGSAEQPGAPPLAPIHPMAPTIEGGVSTSVSTTTVTPSRKVDAIIITMKAILTFIENDPLARSTLASTTVLHSNGNNILDVLNQTATSGSVPKAMAMSLSQTLVTLARSEVLFGTLRHSNAPSIQLDKGKRKREAADDGLHANDSRTYKRPYIPDSDLHTQVTDAVRVITHTLGSSPTQALDSALVSSIRLQLHQVFLFAVTSSAGGGHEMHALQEISGLIQVIGVLSGIQIGQGQDTNSSNPHTFPTNPAYPWLPSQPTSISTDIGTAVYPCLIAGCRKTFSRLYSLRAHQRVHAVHRPYRCTSCPASFARNHDLKRHIKLHDKKAWQCGGCHKMFSRRDAIKRHKNGSKNRGPKSQACIEAEVLEVEVDEEKADEPGREERRAKLWNGIAVAGPQARLIGYPHDTQLEEGEVQPLVISGIQSAVMSLHGLLQAHVGSALGSSLGNAAAPAIDPTAGQATLASVIARAQLQNIPSKINGPPRSAPEAPPVDTDLSLGQPLNDTIISQCDRKSDDIVAPGVPSLSMYGLSDEQTKMLEEAIANAASAAQAQAEAEAAMEEEEDEEEDEEDDDCDESDPQPSVEQLGPV
ncbi:hypothetical protein BDZ94DRAFT_1261382 [Collybia nuda]|uniref:C2H2-type domain-containing protein n=1 Tax=Collybia nuda TaxID=64659 RepID=A0A9P6CJ19_9AGAR|nr:hypothetical protein BDZ94DRAFT_1261382 [Collybia nuda]